MDSLTQIALGAAMGEIVLGRKIGNRAMLWGAIGGTIPDLDIIANVFLEPMDALAMHRGFTHSLLFGIFFPFLVALWPHKIYSTGLYKDKVYQAVAQTIIWLLGAAFVALICAIGYGVFNISLFILVPVWTLIAGFYGYALFQSRIARKSIEINTTYKDWVILFIASIFTHPLLDAFTAYGTQLFLPFSDYRVAFNTISVADPLYTIPFIFCLAVAAYLTRGTSKRALSNWAGIGISSAYLLLTVWNRQRLNPVVDRTAAHHNISVDRCMATPTIFNNLLWNMVMESQDHYHHGVYSFLDSKDYSTELYKVDKNHEIAAPVRGTREMDILTWFTKDYFAIERMGDTLIINDLRYGAAGEDADGNPRYVFSFLAIPQDDGTYEFKERRERPDNGDEIFGDLWERMMGK